MPDSKAAAPALNRPRPSPALFAGIALVVVGVAAGACGKTPPPQVKTKIVCPSASVAASASASPAPKTLAERAAEGDADAVKELAGRARTDRTAAETLALATAAALTKKKDLHELKHKIELVPKLTKDPVTLKKIHAYVEDEQVANAALGMVASLPGPTGPDLLYSLWTGMHGKGETGQLAEDLLYSKDVYKKASPALQALLDLRAADKCEDVANILKKLTVDGDHRAIGSVLRLNSKYGCGPKKMDDCWKCLRGNDLIKNTLKAIAKNHGP
jgi:hypothetical protein